MDGQGSAAAREANERLYAMRAALASRNDVASRRAGAGPSSHSEQPVPNAVVPGAAELCAGEGAATPVPRLPAAGGGTPDQDAIIADNATDRPGILPSARPATSHPHPAGGALVDLDSTRQGGGDYSSHSQEILKTCSNLRSIEACRRPLATLSTTGHPSAERATDGLIGHAVGPDDAQSDHGASLPATPPPATRHAPPAALVRRVETRRYHAKRVQTRCRSGAADDCGLLSIDNTTTCRGEAAAIGVVGTNDLVSPPPRPSLAATEEGSGNRERRPLVSRPRSARLPDPYAIRDYFVNLQQPTAERADDADGVGGAPAVERPAEAPAAPPPATRHSLLATLFATLPAHLGWGSETLAAHVRKAIRNYELGIRNGAGGAWRVAGGAWEVEGGEAPWGAGEPGNTEVPASWPLAPGPWPLEPLDAPPATRHPLLVKVHPDLALAMLRDERAAAGRVWLLLRHLDEAGRGMVSEADARAALTGPASPLRLCGWRRLRQLLAAGDGVFWAREEGRGQGGKRAARGEWRVARGESDNAPPATRHAPRLRLFGPARVAAALGVARLINRPVGVPLAALLGPIGDARAHLFAAFHSGRAKLVTSGEWRVASSERALHSSFATRHSPLATHGSPISRATLSALSGACPRSQAAYEQRARVMARDNYALGERVPGGAGGPVGPAEQERAWRQGRALFRLTDYHGQQGAPGATYLAWRLPNTYGPAWGHQQRPKGRQKRINRQLADLFTKGMTGNGGRPIEKRYFAGAAAAFRRAERGVVDGRSPAHHPITLHWPDGRTRGGAGVWRVVEELNAKPQRCKDAKEESFLSALASLR